MKKLLILLAMLTPLVAVAAEPDHLAICNNLKPDITRSYDVYNLVLVKNGSSFASSEGLVLCVYDGTVRKLHRESDVRVMTTLDVANNKLNVLF